MKYRNRKSKTYNNKIRFWDQDSINWLKEKGVLHKSPYFKKYHRDTCDPHTGKYLGRSDGLTKDKSRQLKRSIRVVGKESCLIGLMDYEDG